MWARVCMLVFVAKQRMTVKVTVGQPAGGPLDPLAGPEQDSGVASRCGDTRFRCVKALSVPYLFIPPSRLHSSDETQYSKIFLTRSETSLYIARQARNKSSLLRGH